MQWNTNQFGANAYQFDYDGANRLSGAVFTGTGQHNTSYTYDKNGNILTLTRQGRYGGSQFYGSIDTLTYTYQGNQLKSVNDLNDGYGPHQGSGFSDHGSFLTTEYFYDDNGNLTSDLNKSLIVNQYNHLNLPEQITLNPTTQTQEVNYLYDATGNKLSKETRINYTTETTTDYVGSFIYENGTLQTILTPEGRVVVDGTNYEYQYFLKDHLGNTRVTFNQTGIIQEDSYYPFGMAMAGLSDASGLELPNKYLYNGKEMQDDFGLGWYDYGARFYDAEIGRWHVVDPMAESRIWVSPYNYAQNNPINRIDPDGMLDDWVERKNGEIEWDENATSQETTKEGETYLGKNVIVATHNRDENGNEDINSAKFELYSEKNKTGSTATIDGNTVPADVEGRDFNTLAEGLYAADFAPRTSKPNESALFISVLGEKDFKKKGILPTTEGGTMSGVFLHSGNPKKATLISRKGKGTQWSEGCQTTQSGPNSIQTHNKFMNKVGKNFSGTYYLRGQPQSSNFNLQIYQVYRMPQDNTRVSLQY
jgi:RHS repeat-associated protein